MMKYLFLAVVAALFVLPLSGCALLSSGAKAVDDAALFEPAALMWLRVVEDINAGVEAGVDSEEITDIDAMRITAHIPAMADALAAKDRVAVAAIPWPMLKAWGDGGIAVMLFGNKIGPGVARKHTEHLDAFDELYARLTTPTR